MLDKIISQTRTLTSFVTFRLSRTQNKLNAQATHFLKANCGLSLVEWRIIQLIRLFEGASMSQLATEVDIDKGQLSRKIKAMVEKGLIATRQDESDQRKQVLALTEAAQEVHIRMMPIMQMRQDRLVAGVTEAELETFFKVLGVLDEAAAFREMP